MLYCYQPSQHLPKDQRWSMRVVHSQSMNHHRLCGVFFFPPSTGTGRFGAPSANARLVSICADKEQRKPQRFLCSSCCVTSRQASLITKNLQQQQSGCQTRNFLVVFKWFYSIRSPTGGAAVDVLAVCLTVFGNKWFYISKNNERGLSLNKKWLSIDVKTCVWL